MEVLSLTRYLHLLLLEYATSVLDHTDLGRYLSALIVTQQSLERADVGVHTET